LARIGRYGILNLVVHPHPEGAYRRLFETLGADPRGVRFHGDRFATISPISETRNGVFTGKLATWTEIDPNSNLIDKSTLKESLLEESDIYIPDGIGFNSKVFSFAFREKDHTLYIELLNDEGQSISINRARSAFYKILSALLPKFIDEFDVHVKVQKNAVEKVLQIEKIRKVEIVLDLPNPDDLTEQKREILREIEEMHAKQIKAEITKSASEETITLTENYLAMAELSADNGHFSAYGRDEAGEAIHRSTKAYPLEIEAPVPADASRALLTRRVAEQNIDT